MTLRLRDFQAVLFDLDGTVYEESRALPGAAELFGTLHAAGILTAAATNSGATPQAISSKLAKMDIALPPERIYPCVQHAAEWIVENWAHLKRKPRVLNLSTPGFAGLLEGKVEWVDVTPSQAADMARKIHADTPKEDLPCDAVAVAAPNNHAPLNASGHSANTFDRIFSAVQFLRTASCQLLGMCADRGYPSPRGYELGSGATTQMLAYAAGVTPVFFGKPQVGYFQKLCQRLNVQPEKCLIIGDNLDSDVAGARAVGMSSAAVLTGVTRETDLRDQPRSRTPDHVFADLTEITV